MGDYHSLLQLLCPDLPLAVVKNAWSSAAAIQAGGCWYQVILSREATYTANRHLVVSVESQLNGSRGH